jgi:methionyl-tRNA formyltransferase
LQPDLIVVAAYGRIIPEPVLSLPPFGCVNVHPSLLPKYRGASPVTAAILNGDAVTGVTIMLLDRGLDSGPILSQEQVEVAHRDTTGTLTQRLAKIGARLLQRTLPRWLNKEVQPQSQDHGQATMTRKVEKEDGRLDWGRPAQELERCVRAYNPWPGAFTRWQGKLLKVWEAEVLEHPLKELPGVVGAVDGGKVGVVTGAGVLGLVRVQLEGRAVLSGVEFVRGARGFVGSRLPS